MKQLLRHIADALPTGLLVAGAAAISAGTAMIWLPAGVIVAGIQAVAGGILLICGKGGVEHE